MLALSTSESCRNKVTKRMEHFFFFILEFGLNEVNAVDDRQEWIHEIFYFFIAMNNNR